MPTHDGRAFAARLPAAGRRRRFTGPFSAALALVTTLLVLGVMPAPSFAISSDYCGQYLTNGARCYEGSGYRGWRYHQSSTGSGGPLLPAMCAYAWTGSNYRTGSGCATGPGGAYTNFYAFQYCSADPISNSSVAWAALGSGLTGPYRVYGHADSRTC